MPAPGVSEDSERATTSPLYFIHGEGPWKSFFWGSDEAKQRWVEEKVGTWGAGVKRLAVFAKVFPQMTYASLTMFLQRW